MAGPTIRYLVQHRSLPTVFDLCVVERFMHELISDVTHNYMTHKTCVASSDRSRK